MRKKVLVIGYGNPGRLDDGLGPALAERLEKLSIPGVTVDANYQLTVEDAATVAEHDVVVFADAAVKGAEPFFFRRVVAQRNPAADSHAVAPEAVLGFARKLFHAKTHGYVLGIRGYEFNEFGQRLSDKAQDNLEQAEKFLVARLKTGKFERGSRQKISKG